MNIFEFSCKKCGQTFRANDKWVGREISCPACQTKVVVPQPSAPVTGPLWSKPLPTPVTAPAPVTPAIPAGRVAPAVRLAPVMSAPRPPQKSHSLVDAALLIGGVLVVMTILAGGAYYVREKTAKVKSGRVGVKAKTQPARVLPKTTNQSTAANPKIRPEPKPKAELPKPEIPSALLCGTVVRQICTLDKAELQEDSILQFRLHNPEKSGLRVFVFLPTKTGESVAGKNFSVPGASKMAPQIHMQWKENGISKSAAVRQGYLMRLEFGAAAGKKIPGKIYLELPKTFSTKLTGTFEAENL